MSLRRRHLGREHGGTFTFISLGLSTLLLVSAGLLAGPSRTTLQGAAASTRRSALREGVFAGARYAGQFEPSATPTRLLLEGCEVTVRRLPDEGGHRVVESEAANGIGERLRLRAHLSASGELSSFELVSPSRSEQAPSPAPTSTPPR